MNQTATLLLEDGTAFVGNSIGASGCRAGEVVFNTAMSGYQEIVSDPSYAGQIITFTFPHIGIVGVNEDDTEATQAHAAGVIVRDYAEQTSNWRSRGNLSDYLTLHSIVGLSGIDTRKLTRHLRTCGVMRGVLYTDDISDADAHATLSDFPGLTGMDVAGQVTANKVYQWHNGVLRLHAPEKHTGDGQANQADQKEVKDRISVVAYDFGIKHNILRLLTDVGCDVTVVPAHTPADDVLKMTPDGVFLSNGPGDPEPCDYAITAIRQLLEAKMPMFGICLGHQLLCLACGATSVKMKFGHHGANHPVLDLDTGQVLITSQNHNFCIDEKTLPELLTVTHRSLFDGTLQGVRHRRAPAFGFQGHPEASPGPHDLLPLFRTFRRLIHTRDRAKGHA